MIYFAQIGADDAPVKIGYARDVARRVAALQCGLPHKIRILRVIEDGDRNLELAFHRHFAADRLTGEWFNFSPELLTVTDPYIAPPPRKRCPKEVGALPARLVAAFGGLSAAARALRHPHVTTVDGWLRSGRIPKWRLWQIREAAARENVTLPHDFPEADVSAPPAKQAAQ